MIRAAPLDAPVSSSNTNVSSMPLTLKFLRVSAPMLSLPSFEIRCALLVLFGRPTAVTIFNYVFCNDPRGKIVCEDNSLCRPLSSQLLIDHKPSPTTR